MLFAFSQRGLDHNWLNPTIIGVIREGIADIDRGRSPTNWPDCVPPAQRPKLRRQFGFRAKLNALWNAYQNLTVVQKAVVNKAIDQQTNLPAVLANDGPCTKVVDLPNEIVKAIGDLFEYMFDQLGSLKEGGQCIRDVQFSTIYQALGARLCPYCGLNYFRAPGAPRHALDHFMPISRYPFVGADLRNLPPVCDECNSRFKGSSDVLFDDGGNRRRCSDPYAGPVYHVRLSSSTLFAGNIVNGFRLPRWQIDLDNGPPEQAEAWDTVFHIKERYIRDVLDADFLSWISHFANWFVRQIGRGRGPDEVAAELPRYIDGVVQDGLADRAFLKAEVFRLIQAGCVSPTQGIVVREWLSDFIEYAV